MRRSRLRLTPPFGLAAAFVAGIVGVALAFTWLIADEGASGRWPLVVLFGIAVGLVAVLLMRRTIRKAGEPRRSPPV